MMSLAAHFEPSPRARALAAGIALVGAAASPSIYALATLLLLCAVILTVQGNISFLLRFIIKLWLPLASGLFIVWGLIIKGSPSSGNGSGIANGVHFAALVSLRIAALAALFQAVVLSLQGLRLANFSRSLGLSPTATATVASIFNLWPDFARRAEQVVAARCARGLMSDRHIWTRVRQIPWVVRTLFVGSLGQSLDRATRWQAERLPDRLAEVLATGETREPNPLINAGWCVAAIVWATWAVWAFLCP